MRERMWLRATCAAAVLLATPGLVGAEKIRSGVSGPFKVQIGVNAQNQPVYQTCGELNMYKTDGGREWRLDDTCDELLDVFVPVSAPTPTPGPIGPTPNPGTPTPGATVSGECPDGFISKATAVNWVLSNINLQEGHDHVWCFDLPASARPFFEVKTVNKSNAQCSDVEMTVISPHGAEYFTNGWQPGVPPLHVVGRWRVKMHLNWGCSRYDIYVNVGL